MDQRNKKTTITFIVVLLVVLGVLVFLRNRRDQEKQPTSGVTENEGTLLVDDEGDTAALLGGLEDVGSDVMMEESDAHMMEGDAMVAGKESSLTARDQAAGSTVHISSLQLQESAWVVIHEDRDGAPGKILGAGRFRSNNSEGVVDLLRNTVAGSKYYAVLHADDGDGSFDYMTELPVANASGGMILSAFRATAR